MSTHSYIKTLKINWEFDTGSHGRWIQFYILQNGNESIRNRIGPWKNVLLPPNSEPVLGEWCSPRSRQLKPPEIWNGRELYSGMGCLQ